MFTYTVMEAICNLVAQATLLFLVYDLHHDHLCLAIKPQCK